MTEQRISALEHAAAPAGLRRVVIDPVTRVEGHGKVSLLLDEHDQVQQARFHIVEFRGFEKFIQGRPYWEVPVMVQRLCGICPVSHNLAASKAMDQIVGVQTLPEAAERIRRLMHVGQVLQSHALHFFHLSSPDLLFGFDSAVAQRHVIGVAERYPEVAKQGILLRKFGQEIIQATTGKRVHGTGNVPGGVQKALAEADRQRLLAQADTMVAWSRGAVQIARELVEALSQAHPAFGHHLCGNLSITARDAHGPGVFDFYDGDLRISDAQGGLVADGLPAHAYGDWIAEQVKPWSYMKFPYLRSRGPEQGWYRVGPLARLQNCRVMPSEWAEQARQAFVAAHGGHTVHHVLAFHWARMIEMLHAAELIRDLLADPRLSAATDLRATGQRQREGVGVIEAPRGTLIHHYQVDDDDMVTYCNLIVSTTHNNQAMNEAIRSVAAQAWNGHQLDAGLLNHIEVAIRAFDPCLSCATHALGQMPLQIELIDGAGQVVDRLVRD